MKKTTPLEIIPPRSVMREVGIYTSLLWKRRPLPPTRFVIFGSERSGSTLLVNLLNSHEDIHCDGEILTRPVVFPRLYIHWHVTRDNFKAYGFKLLDYHLRREQRMRKPGKFIAYLYAQGYQFIYLTRQNLLRHAISKFFARQHTYHNRSGQKLEQKQIHVDIDVLFRWMRGSERSLKLINDQWLKNIPYLSLTYEQDLLQQSSHQKTVDKIVQFLGLPSAPVNTSMTKVTSPRLENFVTNYDDMAQALKNTKYEQFLVADG